MAAWKSNQIIENSILCLSSIYAIADIKNIDRKRVLLEAIRSPSSSVYLQNLIIFLPFDKPLHLVILELLFDLYPMHF